MSLGSLGRASHAARYAPPKVRAIGGAMIANRVPRYVIDLDLPPERRWEQPIAELKHTFPHAIDYLRRSLGYSRGKLYYSRLCVSLLLMLQLYNTLLDIVLERMATSASASLVRRGRLAHSRELLAISHQSGIPVGRLAALQLTYEATAQCTAMIVPNQDDATPLHARTMDWPAPFLQQMTMDVEFQRNSTTLFRGTMFAGSVNYLSLL
jgi:hypothetical protein